MGLEREARLLEPPDLREVVGEALLVEDLQDVHAEVRLQEVEPLVLRVAADEEVAREEREERDPVPRVPPAPVLAEREVEGDAARRALPGEHLLLPRPHVGHPPRVALRREVEEVGREEVGLSLEDRHPGTVPSRTRGYPLRMPTSPREEAGARGLLAPLGTLVALALPFFAVSLASAAATCEAKLAAQSAGAVLVLLGLATSGAPIRRPPFSPAARRTAAALGAVLALFVLSFARGLAAGRDPLDAVALLPALALFAWGATAGGEAQSRRALSLVVLAGAATGLLAALQRFTGFLRLPVEAPEPRFFATALIGNPGDVAAALVVPALLAAASLARGGRRLGAALALAACLAGLAAASTLAPLVAFACGAALLVSLDLRRRLLPAVVAAVLTLALLTAAGVVKRAADKLASGDLSTLTTQRDIGVLAALETIRAHPLLGIGPGGFASDFVRARLAAEARTGRHLVHHSASAHFDNAHCDALTVAAETGIPAAAALAAAFALLLAPLVRAARTERDAAGERVPAETLLAALASVAVLSLANFPLQILPVAGPVAFLAGLAFARSGGRLAAPSRPATRAGLAAAALLLAAGASLRLAGGLALAHAETALRDLPRVSPSERAPLLDSALAGSRRAVALLPRRATAWLALGSGRAALGDLDGAVEAMELSRALGERAETLLNLGRLALARGDAASARPFFVRAVWVLPALAAAVPPAAGPEEVVEETKRLAASLASGGSPPPPPPPLRSR